MTTPAQTLDVLPHQAEFLQADEPETALVAGLGAAKTFSAFLWLLSRGEINAPVPGLAVFPTIPMMRNAFVKPFFEFCRDKGITARYLKNERTIQILDVGPEPFEIWLASADRPELLVGTTVGHCLIDEAGLVPRQAIANLAPRVRHPKAKLHQMALIGTPEGVNNGFFDWCHKDTTRVVRAHTLDNVFLPPSPEEYIATRLSHFSEDERRMYTSGEFIALGGRVYHAYGPHCEERCAEPLAGQQVIGADFGSGVMAWCWGVMRGETLHIHSELVGRNTDTHTQMQEFKEICERQWSTHRKAPVRWDMIRRRYKMHGDAYAAYSSVRANAASLSDHEIVRREGVDVLAPKQNPPVRDRVVSVNEALRTGRLLIDPEGAPYTAKCLSLQGYDKNGAPEKQKDSRNGPPGLDHGADAVGYLAHALFPVFAPHGNDVVQWH